MFCAFWAPVDACAGDHLSNNKFYHPDISSLKAFPFQRVFQDDIFVYSA